MRLIAAVLTLGLVSTACAATQSSEPAPASSAAIPAAEAADRFLPARLQGHKVGKLPPTQNSEVAGHAGGYGVAEWVTGYSGATVGRKELPYAFVSVVEGDPNGSDASLQTVLFATGDGEIAGLSEAEIDGETARFGTVDTGAGPFDFALWQPEPGVVVSVAVGVSSKRLGVEVQGAMEEIISYAKNHTTQ